MASGMLRVAVASAVALAGSLAAITAQADVLLPSTGNSSWALFVRNLNTNQAYARGLTVTVDTVASESRIVGSTYTGPGQLIATEPTMFSSLGPDANLTTFLAACGGACAWTILAGDTDRVAFSDQYDLGKQRYLFANPFDITGAWTSANTDLTNSYSQIDGMFTQLNANLTGAPGEDSSTQPNGLYGQPNTQGENAPFLWGGGYVDNFVGDPAFMYLVTSSGGGAGNTARLYQFGTMTLGADGTLSFVEAAPPIPLPAAGWLLLGGLAGVLGIGRRRSAG